MKAIVKKCDTISRKISATGAKNQVGIKNIRAKLKLFNARLMSTLIYRMEAWGNIRSVKMAEIEKMHETALKRIFLLPFSTAYTAIIMETGI